MSLLRRIQDTLRAAKHLGTPGGGLRPRQVIRHALAMLPRQLYMVAGPPQSQSISLTFDDGPHPVWTPILLDRLNALGVRATFFVVGREAEQHPELVRRMVREGHTVGHHSFTHGEPSLTPARVLLDEARRTSALLENQLGFAPRLFRPPHGKITVAKGVALWRSGYTIVLWNQDPKDYACGSPEPLRQWFSSTPLAAGDIFLLHDNHPHAADALEVLVSRARRQGLTFATPADWLTGS